MEQLNGFPEEYLSVLFIRIIWKYFGVIFYYIIYFQEGIKTKDSERERNLNISFMRLLFCCWYYNSFWFGKWQLHWSATQYYLPFHSTLFHYGIKCTQHNRYSWVRMFERFLTKMLFATKTSQKPVNILFRDEKGESYVTSYESRYCWISNLIPSTTSPPHTHTHPHTGTTWDDP